MPFKWHVDRHILAIHLKKTLAKQQAMASKTS